MIGIIICCCQKYYKNYKKCSKRWADVRHNNPSVKFFYLFGTPGKTKYYSKTSKLKLNVEDDYESLPKKIYSAVHYIIENHPEIKGIFKTDDDIEFYDCHGLVSELESLSNSGKDYAGIVVDICGSSMIQASRLTKFNNLNNNNVYSHDQAMYCHGAGYYISKLAAKHICENKNFIYKRYLEDVTIGHILNRYDIFPIKMHSKCREISRDVA